MDSLEWINAEIAKWQEILESFKEQLKQVKGTRNEQVTLNHIECYEFKLKYLQQIKTELEAWYETKKYLVLNEKTLAFYDSTFEYITLKNDCIDESNSEEEGISIISIKKALEVKENDNSKNKTC